MEDRRQQTNRGRQQCKYVASHERAEVSDTLRCHSTPFPLIVPPCPPSPFLSFAGACFASLSVSTPRFIFLAKNPSNPTRPCHKPESSANRIHECFPGEAARSLPVQMCMNVTGLQERAPVCLQHRYYVAKDSDRISFCTPAAHRCSRHVGYARVRACVCACAGPSLSSAAWNTARRK